MSHVSGQKSVWADELSRDKLDRFRSKPLARFRFRLAQLCQPKGVILRPLHARWRENRLARKRRPVIEAVRSLQPLAKLVVWLYAHEPEVPAWPGAQPQPPCVPWNSLNFPRCQILNSSAPARGKRPQPTGGQNRETEKLGEVQPRRTLRVFLFSCVLVCVVNLVLSRCQCRS